MKTARHAKTTPHTRLRIAASIALLAAVAAVGFSVPGELPAGAKAGKPMTAAASAAAPTPLESVLPSPTPPLLTTSPLLISSSPVPSPTASRPAPPKIAKPGKAVVIFTFDDGAESDYLLAYPILKKYGIKGTSYLITKFTDNNIVGKLTWQQVKEMSGYGWVFGCHTYDHRRMTSMTDDEIRKSLEAVNQSFLRQGFHPPEIMAYPYGAHDQRVIHVVKRYRKQARAYGKQGFVDLEHINPYEIPDIKANMRTKDELDRLEKLVDKACGEKAVVVFCLHTLYKQKPYDTVKTNHEILSGSAPQTSSKLFGELVKYCVDKKCAFMTMTGLMDLYS